MQDSECAMHNASYEGSCKINWLL